MTFLSSLFTLAEVEEGAARATRNIQIWTGDDGTSSDSDLPYMWTLEGATDQTTLYGQKYAHEH